MALVARGATGWFITIILTDTQFDDAPLRFEMTAADYTEAQTERATIIAAVEGMTGATVTAVHMSEVLEENAFVAPVGADNSIKARLVYQLSNRTETARRDIPAPLEAIFVAPSGPNNNIVDVTNPAVVAFAQLSQVNGQVLISDGETTDNLLKGQRVSKATGLR